MSGLRGWLVWLLIVVFLCLDGARKWGNIGNLRLTPVVDCNDGLDDA